MTEGPDEDGTGTDGADEEAVTADQGADRVTAAEPVEDGRRNPAERERGDPAEEASGDPEMDDGDGADADPEDEAEATGRSDPETAGSDASDGSEGSGGSGAVDEGKSVDEDGSRHVDGSSDENESADVDGSADGDDAAGDSGPAASDVPADVRKYDRFKKIDGGTYDRANEFLRDRTYITAREWAIARLCADFRTETGVEMTKIGENLPRLVPFMTDTYTPQAVNQARASFEEKVRKSGATFLYGAMCDFFTASELDDVMYEATEVAKFLLEVEGVELSVDEELAAEDRISEVMREVREHSAALRHDEMTCPECGHEMNVGE